MTSKIWLKETMIINIIVTIIFIFSFSFLSMRGEENLPYGVGNDAICMESPSKVILKNSNLNLLTDFKDLTVVAETDNSKVIGVYDPQFKFYLNSSKYEVRNEFRYFSMEDYKRSNNVCVIFDEINQERIPILPKSKQYVLDGINVELKPINCLSFTYWNKYGKIETFANIFTIPSTSIKIMYLDSPNIDNIIKIKCKLEKQGFIEKKVQHPNRTLYQIYKDSVDGRKYNIFIQTLLLWTIATYIILLIVICKNNSKLIEISDVVGADFRKLLSVNYVYLTITILVAYVLVASPVYAYMRFNRYNKLSHFNLIELFMLELILAISCYTIVTILIYLKNKRIMR